MTLYDITQAERGKILLVLRNMPRREEIFCPNEFMCSFHKSVGQSI